MKIDLSLVQGGVLRDSALAVLTAIQDIAGRADATVIAEGIETVDQLDVIREVGISHGQGFLLANPAPELQSETIGIDTPGRQPPGTSPLPARQLGLDRRRLILTRGRLAVRGGQ